MKLHSALPVFTAFLLAILSGCNDKNAIQVYKAPSSKPAESPAHDSACSMTQNAPPANAASQQCPVNSKPAMDITSTTPAGWEPQPLSSMRQASFMVKGNAGAAADISLVTLNRAAGDVLDNVNRWLSQLDQPALTQDKLNKIIQRVPSSLGEVTLVDLQGQSKNIDPAKDGRIIAGIVPNGDKVFFFKMRGNAALVGAQKDNFVKWIGSVKMGK